jgi:NADH-quinone oxidoreductase subunit B
MGLEEQIPEGILTVQLEKMVNWSRQNSTWPLLFGLACCAIEMIAAGGARYDIARYGSELFRASPRQADLMIVSGRVSYKMAPVIKRLHDQMLEPKWVIAMGICASAGGPFNNYAIVQGVDKIIPVDVYVPGCPPRPAALLFGVVQRRGKQGK